MALSTVLASGTSAANSSYINVSAGMKITVGLFASTTPLINVEAGVFIKTPADDLLVGSLSRINNFAMQITGPGTYFVRRADTVMPFGAFTNDGLPT